jgi:hypothetical protein
MQRFTQTAKMFGKFYTTFCNLDAIGGVRFTPRSAVQKIFC